MEKTSLFSVQEFDAANAKLILKEVNPLYENQISDEVLNSLSEKIENDSNIIETYIIPLKEHFPEEINEKLSDEIDVICKTLDFSSKIVKRKW